MNLRPGAWTCGAYMRYGTAVGGSGLWKTALDALRAAVEGAFRNA